MKKLIAVFATLALGACAASVDQITTPDGKQGFSVSCNGSADSWSKCYTAATKACNGQYSVLDKNQASTPTGLGPMVERNMVIQCKA